MTAGDIVDIDFELRAASVIRNFIQCGSLFRRACNEQDNGLAQEAAIIGLSVLAELFPGDNNEAHSLLASLMGMIVGAQWGRTDHVLLRQPLAPVEGTRKGLGHACLAAFAVTAIRLLVDQGMSDRAARKIVAGFLREHGLSLRRGEHGEASPISESAIRNWCEADLRVHREIGDVLFAAHSDALARRGANTQDAVVEYLREQSGIAVREYGMI